jgi:hypothetical protein
MHATLFISVLLIGFQQGPGQAPLPEIPLELLPAVQEAKLRAELAKKIGGKDDDHFLLLFKQAIPATIPNGTPLPQGAQRLPRNRWLETAYQPELVEGKQATIDLLVKFFVFAKTHSEAGAAIYDWKFVASYADPKEAQKKYKEAEVSAMQNSVTFRPRTKVSLTFFNPDREDFLEKLRPR